MWLVEQGWKVLTQALSVEKHLQSHSHHHVDRAAFLIPEHKCSVSGLSLCLAHQPKAQISETPGEHPQVPLGEIKHIKQM